MVWENCQWRGAVAVTWGGHFRVFQKVCGSGSVPRGARRCAPGKKNGATKKEFYRNQKHFFKSGFLKTVARFGVCPEVGAVRRTCGNCSTPKQTISKNLPTRTIPKYKWPCFPPQITENPENSPNSAILEQPRSHSRKSPKRNGDILAETFRSRQFMSMCLLSGHNYDNDFVGILNLEMELKNKHVIDTF